MHAVWLICPVQHEWSDSQIVTHAEDQSHLPWPQLNEISIKVSCAYITSENVQYYTLKHVHNMILYMFFSKRVEYLDL